MSAALPHPPVLSSQTEGHHTCQAQFAISWLLQPFWLLPITPLFPYALAEFPREGAPGSCRHMGETDYTSKLTIDQGLYFLGSSTSSF